MVFYCGLDHGRLYQFIKPDKKPVIRKPTSISKLVVKLVLQVA
jgi:hypothetical protein